MSDPETNSNNKEEEPKKDIPKSKGVSNLDIEKLKALNVKFTKSLSFKIVLVGLIIFIVASSAYLAYLSFGQNSYSYDSLNDNKNKQMEVALLEAKKFADDSPIKAIKAIENYKTLAPLLENRKNYILTKLYQEIDEPALAFIRSYEIDKNYLSKYTSYERAKLAEKMGLEAVVVNELEFLSRKYPKEPKYLYELGKSYARQSLKEEATKVFTSIQKIFPDTDYSLGSDYYLANLTSDETEKISRLKNYLTKSPTGSLAYLISDQLNIVDSEDSSLSNYKAISYYNQGNYSKAVNFFDTKKDSPDLYLEAYAKTLVKLNRKTEAVTLLKEYLPRLKDKDIASDLVEFLADNRSRYSMILDLQALSGKMESGIEDKILWEIAKRTKNKEDYQKIYSVYPDSYYAAESMARAFWQEYERKNYHKALEMYEEHWKKYTYANSHSFVAFWAGKIYLDKKKEPENARAVFQNLIIEHPTNYYSYRADQILSKKDDWYKLPSPNTFLSFPTWRWPGVYPDAQIVKLYGSDILELTKINEYDFVLELADKKEIDIDKDFEMWLDAQAGNYEQAIKTAARSLTKDTPIDYKNIKYQYAYPLAYADIISDEVSEHLKVDPILAHSLIRQESFYQKDIVSKVGAVGLMQLMPYTAKDVARTIGVKPPRPYDLMRPEINIKLGIKYMEEVFQRFDNNMINAIASYNAGPVAVKNWIRKYKDIDADEYLENIPYDETKTYVKHVLNNYWIYKKLYT